MEQAEAKEYQEAEDHPIELFVKGELAIALLSPGQIFSMWEDVLKEKIEIAISESDSEYASEWVLQQVMKNQANIWVTYDGSGIQCVVVVEPIVSPKGIWANLPFAWCNKSLHVYNATWDLIEEWARESGAYGIKYISDKPGLASMAKRRGMRPRFIEYIKEFKRD